MTEFLDFIPLINETVESIRARLNADANAGLSTSDADYRDTTEGGAFYDLTQGAVLDSERLWDFLGTEVVAAMFVQSAWGFYLDEHGAMLSVPRKAESFATGEVTFFGTDGTPIPSGAQVAQPSSDPDVDPITFVTTANGTIGATVSGEITIPVIAEGAGPSGNMPIGQVVMLLTGIDDVTSVLNEMAITGGADVESDEDYQARLLLEWRAPGAAGNIADYKRWALAYPSVGDVTVTPVWAGANTVRLVVTDPDGNAVSAAVRDGLKALLDPGDGTGAGLAPIGANVTVATVTAVTVPVAANVKFASGYSLTGTGGTYALSDVIKQVIGDYINGLSPGEDVIRAKVESLFFRVAGVDDVAAVTLNGVAANFVIADTEVAQITSANFTLGTL